MSALTSLGEKTFCWTYADGHAVRTEIQTGVSDGKWIEVTNRKVPAATGGADRWVPFDGTEQVILGDLSILADGGPVTLAQAKEGTKVASETPAPDHRPAGAHPGTPAGSH